MKLLRGEFIKKLIKLADKLDLKGDEETAEEVDQIIGEMRLDPDSFPERDIEIEVPPDEVEEIKTVLEEALKSLNAQ